MRDRALLAILALALLLNLVGLDWGLPWNVSWSVDDISPWKPLAAPWYWLRSFHKYPYLHWFVSLATYLPYLAWLALRGGLDVGCLPTILIEKNCFADPFGAPGTLMAISRVLSAAMGAGIAAAAYALARALDADRAAARLAAAITAVAQVVVVWSHLGNPDVPAAFWVAWSLVFAVRVARGGTRRDHVLCGLSVAAALTTKDTIIGVYMFGGPLVWWLHARRAGRVLDRDLVALAASLVVAYVLVQNVVFNFSGFVQHWLEWIPTGEFMTAERRESPGVVHVLGRIGEAWVEGLGWPLALLCAAGLAFACVRRQPAGWLAVPALSYVVSLVVSAFVSERMMLPLVPMGAVGGGLLAERLLRAPRGLAAVGALAVALLLGHGLVRSAYADGLFLRDGRYVAEAWFRGHAQPGARVASCSARVDLPRLDRLGFAPVFVSRGEDCRARLAELAPDYVVASSASPEGVFRTLPGWRVAWEGRGETPLDRWASSPYSWLNPRIRVFVPDPALTPRRGR